MNSWIIPVYYIVDGMLMLLVALGFGVALLMPGIDRWSRGFFIAFFSALLLAMIALIVDGISFGRPALKTWEGISIGLEYLFTSMLMPMLTVYLLHCCGKPLRSSPLFRAVMGLWGVYILLLIVNQFTELFYGVSPEGVFYHSARHPLLLAPLALILLITLVGAIRWRGSMSRKQFRAMIVYLVPMTLAMIVYTFVYIPLFISIGISACTLSMFAIILSDQVEQFLRQQREIAHQQANIMVLQMRPHFIYNTMTSIYYLCDQDPARAKQVTMDFTTYLRKNFTAIASDHTIPFPEELEHTRAYLAVEQAQFEDSLFVEYDTPHTRFRVPPLTLQPIVENAVKHGMDPDSEPLRITIQTRETDSGSEITVADNGPGFEPANDDEPHIALANIRQRLEMMGGGKLAILPREGGGTVVKVTIPGE